jgi:hypothetical protein
MQPVACPVCTAAWTYAEGNFLFSFGQGIFNQRTHGVLLVGPDDSVYCADDGTHTITKFTPDGKLRRVR